MLVLLTLAVTSCFLSTATTKEYCQFESFNVSCATNQVIVMEEARYGRLQLGRCVTRDYGFIGCSSNVLDLLDRSCSGQQQCSFIIPTLRDLVQPCPKDLTSYLDASYKCVTVFNKTRCISPIQLDTEQPEVYLHSAGLTSQLSDLIHTSSSPTSLSQPLTMMTSYSPCRVMAKTLPGQHVDFVLFSFGHHFDAELSELEAGANLFDVDGDVDDGQATGRFDTRCSESIHIVDGETETSAALCQPRQRRQLLYSSVSSTVWVYFSPPGVADHRRLNYVLKLEANGCADFIPPLNGHVERTNDRIVVKCNYSLETWFMTCKGTEWIGSVTNCTDNIMPLNDEIVINKRRKIPAGLIMAIFTGVVLGIIFGLLMLVTVLVYRRRFTRHHRANSKINALLGNNRNNGTYTPSAEYQPSYIRHGRHGNENLCTSARATQQNGQQLNVELHTCLPAPPPPPTMTLPRHCDVLAVNHSSLMPMTYPVGYDVTTGKRLGNAVCATSDMSQDLNLFRRLERPSSIPLAVRHCILNNEDGINNDTDNRNNNNGPDIVQSRQQVTASSAI